MKIQTDAECEYICLFTAQQELEGLTMSERIETLVPLFYIVSFLIAYYGPNAEVLGNVKLSIWQYRSVEDPAPYLKNVILFFAIDFMSAVCNGILLWTTCKINVFKVLKNLQKTYWLIWASQEGALFLEVKIKQNLN